MSRAIGGKFGERRDKVLCISGTMRIAAQILGRAVPRLRSNAPLRMMSAKARRKAKDDGSESDTLKKVNWRYLSFQLVKMRVHIR